MDADDEPDPGAAVLPTVFYGLWPRSGLEDGEAGEGADHHRERVRIAAG